MCLLLRTLLLQCQWKSSRLTNMEEKILSGVYQNMILQVYVFAVLLKFYFYNLRTDWPMSRKKLSINQNSRKNSQRCVQKYDTTSLRLRSIIKISISIKTALQRPQKIRTFSHFSTLRGCFRERIDQCQGKTSRSTYIKNKILIMFKNIILQVCAVLWKFILF